MTTIQVLVNRQSDRDAFGELIPSQYEIQQNSEVHDADLYLVEDSLLSKHEDALQQRKDNASPVFCPVIIIQQSSGQRSAFLKANSKNEYLAVVDDLLQAPVSRQRLVKRVESLITRREQSQKMYEKLVELEDKNQEMEHVSSVLSHDLRNSIQVANGRLKLLEQAATDATVDEHIEPIARSIKRIDSLTNDMLKLLREEVSEDERQEVPLVDVVRDTWNNSARVRNETTLNLSVKDDLTIYGIRNQLLQVFENLLRNAIVHGGSNIRVGSLDDLGGFFVEDDGPGIPPDKRDQIFTPGYSTKGSEVETGLGLSIVQKVSENHGWDLLVTDSDTSGARFEIRTN